MALTDTTARNAKPKPYKFSDEKGMFLLAEQQHRIRNFERRLRLLAGKKLLVQKFLLVTCLRESFLKKFFKLSNSV